MATHTTKYNASDETWDDGSLGRDEASVEVVRDSQELDAAINESLGLKLVSIRLQKSLIEDFKTIAKYNGIGYQPLMRQVLTRFAEAEKKRIIKQLMSEVERCEAERHIAKEETNKAPTKRKRA